MAAFGENKQTLEYELARVGNLEAQEFQPNGDLVNDIIPLVAPSGLCDEKVHFHVGVRGPVSGTQESPSALWYRQLSCSGRLGANSCLLSAVRMLRNILASQHFSSAN